MVWTITFSGVVKKFPGPGGWVYVEVPDKCAGKLKSHKRAWGMCPITAHIGNTTWKTKLMMKKGGDFFVALKAAVRKAEKIDTGSTVTASIKLD
jgi:hypothetical protein